MMAHRGVTGAGWAVSCLSSPRHLTRLCCWVRSPTSHPLCFVGESSAGVYVVSVWRPCVCGCAWSVEVDRTDKTTENATTPASALPLPLGCLAHSAAPSPPTRTLRRARSSADRIRQLHLWIQAVVGVIVERGSERRLPPRAWHLARLRIEPRWLLRSVVRASRSRRLRAQSAGHLCPRGVASWVVRWIVRRVDLPQKAGEENVHGVRRRARFLRRCRRRRDLRRRGRRRRRR